jgi:ketosteroid isomerase-like protein
MCRRDTSTSSETAESRYAGQVPNQSRVVRNTRLGNAQLGGPVVGNVTRLASPAAVKVRAYAGDVNSKPTEIAREGLAAWRKGDFGTVEEILDRNVEWHATEPGEWDCHGRGEVMETLRERYEQGFAKGDLQFREGGEHAVIVVAHPSEIGGSEWPSEIATVMQFRNERVVLMQDYRTEAEALAAVEQK